MKTSLDIHVASPATAAAHHRHPEDDKCCIHTPVTTIQYTLHKYMHTVYSKVSLS